MVRLISALCLLCAIITTTLCVVAAAAAPTISPRWLVLLSSVSAAAWISSLIAWSTGHIIDTLRNDLDLDTAARADARAHAATLLRGVGEEDAPRRRG